MFKLRHLTYKEYCIELCTLFNEKDYETERRKERKKEQKKNEKHGNYEIYGKY